jgi:arylsulfatase A-like enzyme
MASTRRQFLATAASTLASPRLPNVIVIFADDLGYGDLACYGSKVNSTPNLDRMAAEGARCTDFYVPMPFCAPSRGSLLTGRYPFRTTVVNNPAPDSGINDVALPQSEITIAEALKARGYATSCIGKWHLGHLPASLPRTQGFDEYYGILYSNDMRPVQLIANERVAEYPVPQSEITKKYTARALDFIERNRSRPFFLYLPHAMPHKPLAASEDYYRKVGNSKELYAAVIRELDASVGSILDKVKSLGLDRNTMVVFLSDNGPWFGGSSGPLRAMKGATFDGGIRVPCIARFPGKIPAGKVIREVCASIDLFPTICNLAGVPAPKDRAIDGKDILPLLSGAVSKSPHEAIFAMGGQELRVVRSGKWKLHARVPQPGFAYQEDASKWVDARGPDGVTLIAPYEQARPNEYPGLRTGPEPKAGMLFDMEQDPGEQNDVAAQNPDVVARLKKLFDEMDAQMPKGGFPGVKGHPVERLKGGELRYDKR